MKRSPLIWIATLFSLLLLPHPIFALDFGDSRRTHLLSFNLLAEAQERDVVEKGGKLIGLKIKGDADSTRLLVRAGLHPTPSIELYGLVGGADLGIDDFDRFDASIDVAYGGGLGLVLFQSSFPRALRLFLDGYYLHFTAKDRVETIIVDASTGIETLTPQDEEIRWDEYVAKFGLETRHDLFRPYGGIRFSLVRGKDLLSVSGKTRLEEDDNLGVFGGVDIFLDPTEAVALSLELSLFDVNSFRAGLKLAF